MIKQIKDKIAQMQNKPRIRLLVIGVGGLILLMVDIFFIFLPLLNKSYTLKSQIVSAKKNIAFINQQISMLDTTKKRLSAIKVERIAYGKRFPKEEEVPALLGSLSTIAGKLGVEIIAVKPVKLDLKAGEEAAVSLFHEIPVEIAAKGGFHQIGQFVNKLETFDKFIKVQDIEITADKTTPRRHFFRVLVSTYILKG